MLYCVYKSVIKKAYVEKCGSCGKVRHTVVWVFVELTFVNKDSPVWCVPESIPVRFRYSMRFV